MSYLYGAVPVAGCGVSLYGWSMSQFAAWRSTPSVRAIAAVLFMSLLKPSTCPWSLGCRGVIFFVCESHFRCKLFEVFGVKWWSIVWLDGLKLPERRWFFHLLSYWLDGCWEDKLDLWVSWVLVGYDQCILFAWEWSTEIDFNGLPRYLWQIRHFGWFCMLCVCHYWAVKASAHNGVNAIVHGREPILSM